jgi:hypothetical protein
LGWYSLDYATPPYYSYTGQKRPAKLLIHNPLTAVAYSIKTGAAIAFPAVVNAYPKKLLWDVFFHFPLWCCLLEFIDSKH